MGHAFGSERPVHEHWKSEMIKGKDFEVLYMKFLLTRPFVERETDKRRDYPLKRVQKMLFEHEQGLRRRIVKKVSDEPL